VQNAGIDRESLPPMTSRIADLIDGLEFFQGFAYRELETVSRYLSYRTADKAEIIFNEGDPGTYMLILIEGRVSILKAGEHGRHLLSYEGRGRIVGDMALIDRELRSATCVAETECEFLSLNHEGLDRLAVEHPGLAYRFMFCLARLLSRRLRRTSGVLAEHLMH
jgi:CRP/FNR family transcriptional regulator, cyclic AMP receptor protein